MKLLFRHRYLTVILLGLVALGLFLVLTNPSDINVGLLVIPVVLFFFITFCTVQLVLSGLRLIASQPRKRRMVSIISASLLTVIMILQSTGGIAGVDIILLGLIILVSTIYISKF